MKICPLITQSFVMDGDDLLVREADSTDLDEKEGSDGAAPSGVIPLDYKNETDEESGKADGAPSGGTPSDGSDGESNGGAPEGAAERGVRFVAKSYRGEVECLGAICRFHDEETNACRLEKMLDRADADRPAAVDGLEPIKLDVEKIWEFQQQSTSEILGLFKELEGKNDSLLGRIEKTFEEKWEKIENEMTEALEESRKSLKDLTESIRSDLESKIESEEEKLAGFRKDITEWRDILDKNFEAIESDLESNKKIIGELSGNHAEIVKLIEMQKSSLEDEERRRMLAEVRRINNAGVAAYHNGHYEKALELFEKCTEMDPGFTEGYNNLGLTCTELDMEERATEAFKKAIELNPELAATYNNLGYVFYRLGSLQEAVEMYQEAICRSKDNGSAYTNLGNAYYKLDRVEEAIEAWQKAVEIDPSNEKARRNLKRFHAETVKS
ncbi:MAG TPA: tetratricopeptide repeat protein [Candidatus Eisenbacteria bacterium]|uniref:Tetratricopeptide repeat protein n=1 Tax=Eiseniibacteriota bacterium TaxID=2212470 RepID=A0A7V2AWH9_UNCEI|nr:tetratricopeptide repeat protein [Candidatus Eisenbacteria bacterium]